MKTLKDFLTESEVKMKTLKDFLTESKDETGIKKPEDAVNYVRKFLTDTGHKIAGETDHTPAHYYYDKPPLSHSIHIDYDKKNYAEKKVNGKTASENLADHLESLGWKKHESSSRYYHPTIRGISVLPTTGVGSVSRIHISGDHRDEHPGDRDHEHHKLDTASKVRNYITKNIGGEVVKSIGDSNPYDDTQRLQHYMKKSQGQNLEKHLVEKGWKPANKAGSLFNSYSHPTRHNVSVSVRHTQPNEKKPLTWVTIYGPKKAKRITLPFYD